MSTAPDRRKRSAPDSARLLDSLSSHAGVLVHGDSLLALRSVASASVDLIYIDPPFNTGRQRRLQSIELGRGDKQRNGYQGRTYAYEVTSDLSYPDAMPRPDYLEFMRLRLVEARRVLRKCGSIYVHLDRHSVHHIRLLMDEVFGEERFLNEIIWAYDYGGRPRDRWPPKHDNILWYANSDTWTFNTDAVERIPYMAPSLVGPEKAARGKLPTDVWWITIVPTNGTERTGYPTQKPEKLLERLIVASSNQGDLVLDFFGGSGTTAAVAQRLGRKWVYVDINPEAVRIAQARIDAQMGGLFGPPYEVLRLDTVGLQAGE